MQGYPDTPSLGGRRITLLGKKEPERTYIQLEKLYRKSGPSERGGGGTATIKREDEEAIQTEAPQKKAKGDNKERADQGPAEGGEGRQ